MKMCYYHTSLNFYTHTTDSQVVSVAEVKYNSPQAYNHAEDHTVCR